MKLHDPEEFASLISLLARQVAEEWRHQAGADPENFPERLSIVEWWRHFEVIIPEHIHAPSTRPQRVKASDVDAAEVA